MLSLLCAVVMVFYVPLPPGFENMSPFPLPYFDDYGDDDDQNLPVPEIDHEEWFEEQLEADLKWSFALNGVLHAETSEFQDIVLLDTKRFGKALVIDGKLQSAEKDEFIYSECLVHPALLIHDNPKTVFIMGGSQGSTAREALKHKDLEKVVMCDIDKVLVDFCRLHLTANEEAYRDERLQIAINDAKEELEKSEEKYDVIIGDLADPIEGGTCNHLYTKSFYQQVLKPRLKDHGIFVTQGGPADVIAYTAHIPSYADSWGWVLASDEELKLDVEELKVKIKERMKGDLYYLDGDSIFSSTVLNKTVSTA
ncbi:hypothetical protein FEM48_Zijuj08G0017300 [Ziziphus jujuba var. spinosa]|uniref:thermospermine synthase n=1 Tax=Ziziphus jujuba var. spinosa TaxID=714518 RepID=A0A978UW95_ZIZJJ|nr:hypothetical protein FEM48_Zijuj08G0017300 [Ziziphus jujuba var. spinosa]